MKKKFKKISSVFLITALVLTLFTMPVFAESRAELGLKSTPDDIAAMKAAIGDISPAAIKAGQDKSALAQKVVEIWEKSKKSPQSVTENDRETIQTFIDQYCQGSSVNNYINQSSSNTPSVITPDAVGDGQTLNLWLPGMVQTQDNYCAAATCYAILQGRGINVSEATMATRLGISPGGAGAVLSKVCPALNYYNGSNGNYFNYALATGPGSYTSAWQTSMTNNAIATLLGNYGVVYDVHMINSSGSARLAGYETMYSSDIKHYVAGEGFNSTDTSNKICYYYDSNNLKTNLGNRHMNVTFYIMSRLTDDMGICF